MGFVREAWHILEPTQPYIHGWHLDYIAAHLEAITYGRFLALGLENRLLINVPPGPMRADSLVETARGVVALADVKAGDRVLTHRGRYREVIGVHDQGVLPILSIVTHSGRVTHAAPTHPYLTPRGWVEAADLRIGDALAIVNRQEDRPGAASLPDEVARLLGYLVGDGSLTIGTPGVTNADPEVIDDFRRCAAAAGFDTAETQRPTHWHVRLSGGASVRAFLKTHGLFGASSYTKRIPPAVMNADRLTIASFIGAYWTCDGGFDVRPTRERRSRYRAYGTTVSEGLAGDLVYALGLLGIEARLRRKARPLDTSAQPGGTYRSFSVEVQQEAATALFADLPGLCSRKRALAEQCRRGFSRDLWGDLIVAIEEQAEARCLCLTVEEDGSFVCSGIAVKNTMKSLLSSVFWPAWEWGPAGLATLRYLSTSYSKDDLATRDARKMRNLVMSDWFQERWPMRMVRKADDSFENHYGGWREALAFKNLTGGRGDRLIIDDPHSTTSAESDAELETTIRTFRESVPLRLNDPVKSAIMGIMQRLGVGDVSGVALSMGLRYVHVMLPMEFEPDRRCVSPLTGPDGKHLQDPRTYAGELLFPERFPRETVERDKVPMGVYAIAGQFQQRPTLREGGLFQREWFNPIPIAPVDTAWVRGWDLASSKEQAGQEPAYTAGVKLGRVSSTGRFVIGHALRVRSDGQGVRKVIKQTAVTDGEHVEIDLPQDPAQAGKAQAADMVLMLAGYMVKASRESGDKITRAEPFANQCEAGNVDIVVGDWNEAFIDEAVNFPGAKLKDQIDAASRAFARLIGKNVFAGKEQEMVVEPLKIAGHWPQAFAMVLDPERFAAVYMARDPRADVIYLTAEFDQLRQPIPVHVEAMKKRGKWLPGLFDPKDRKRDEQEGLKIAERMVEAGLELSTYEGNIDAGVEMMLERIATGRLKVFNTMQPWLAGYRRYRTNLEGKKAEEGDHLIRATAGLMLYGAEIAKSENRNASDNDGFDEYAARGFGSATGY